MIKRGLYGVVKLWEVVLMMVMGDTGYGTDVEAWVLM